jgi:hypothetical protein
MFDPITAGATREVLELDPIMDRGTALHCSSCGETETPDGLCLNMECETAARRATPRLAPASAYRAWSISGRVD